MRLLETLHDLWAAHTALNAALASSRVFTGLNFTLDPPYATILKDSDIYVAQDNAGQSVDTIGVTIQVFHENHDAGARIVDRIKACYNRTHFTLNTSSSSSGEESDRVIAMQRQSDSEFQEDDGTWRFVVGWTVSVFLREGY